MNNIVTLQEEVKQLTETVAKLQWDREFLRTELGKADQKIADLEIKLKGYQAWERNINEALNSGDGSYRP